MTNLPNNEREQVREQARKELRQILKGHDTIRTIAEWTGQTAYIRLFVIKNNQLVEITHDAGCCDG